jgi:hypothetical protein
MEENLSWFRKYLWGRGEVYEGFWWGNLRERENLEGLSVDGRIILKCILSKWDERAWTG